MNPTRLLDTIMTRAIDALGSRLSWPDVKRLEQVVRESLEREMEMETESSPEALRERLWQGFDALKKLSGERGEKT